MAGNKSFGGGFADGVKGGIEMAKGFARMKKLMDLENAKPKLVTYDEGKAVSELQDAPNDPHSIDASAIGVDQTSDAISENNDVLANETASYGSQDMENMNEGFNTPTFEAPQPTFEMPQQGMSMGSGG